MYSPPYLGELWSHHLNRTSADETAEYENFYALPQDLYGQTRCSASARKIR